MLTFFNLSAVRTFLPFLPVMMCVFPNRPRLMHSRIRVSPPAIKKDGAINSTLGLFFVMMCVFLKSLIYSFSHQIRQTY